MIDRYSPRRYRTLWWASVPLWPGLAAQGRWLRRTLPGLPEAAGPRDGVVSNGSASLSIAVLGESTAVGVGAADQHDALAGHLARELAATLALSVHWQAVGRPGLTLPDFEDQLLGRLTTPVDVAVVVAGVNDVLRLTSERRWSGAIRSLVGVLHERGVAAVIFPGVPPLGRIAVVPRPLRTVLGVRASLLDLLLQRTLADLPAARYVRTSFPPQPAYLAGDGFHPSPLGYRHWAAAIAARLTRSEAPDLTAAVCAKRALAP